MEGEDHTQRNTAIGSIALVLWASAIPFAKRISEDLGPLTAVSSQYIISGLLGLALIASTGGIGREALLFLRNREFHFRIALFVGYAVLLYSAVGSVPRDKLPVVTLLNYMWPTLTMLLSVILLAQPVRGALFAVGSAIVISGLALEIVGEQILTLLSDSGNAPTLLAYLSAAIAASVWGLYSVLNRKWGERAGGGRALPFVLVIAGVAILVIRFIVGEESRFSHEIMLPYAYLCVMPFLSNVCWDIGTRRGSITVLSLMADILPWASLTIANLYLGIEISKNTWISAVLIVVGALTSRVALLTPKAQN